MSQVVLDQSDIQFLSVGTGDNQRDIAYLVHSGDPEKPGIFWLSGFKSSMLGQKANALAEWAGENNHTYTRMDYSGHGSSTGDFCDGTITRWLEEAIAVFETTTSGPQLIIGSSMGSWIALLLMRALQARDRAKGRIAGLILIAPAWDMTERLMFARFSDVAKATLDNDGFFARPSAYEDGDYIITRTLIEDGRNHLIGEAKLHLDCPVHILHGRRDDDVPWQHGQNLMTLLPRDDVTFTLVPDGDHRLSRDDDLALLLKTIETMI